MTFEAGSRRRYLLGHELICISTPRPSSVPIQARFGGASVRDSGTTWWPPAVTASWPRMEPVVAFDHDELTKVCQGDDSTLEGIECRDLVVEGNVPLKAAIGVSPASDERVARQDPRPS